MSNIPDGWTYVELELYGYQVVDFPVGVRDKDGVETIFYFQLNITSLYAEVGPGTENGPGIYMTQTQPVGSTTWENGPESDWTTRMQKLYLPSSPAGPGLRLLKKTVVQPTAPTAPPA